MYAPLYSLQILKLSKFNILDAGIELCALKRYNFLCIFFWQEVVDSGVIMKATMSDITENTYMVRVDLTNFS